MDVRLSPEQQALRDSVVLVVDRLAPAAVGQLGEPERMAELDAAVAASGWRELRSAGDGSAPLASGVEAAIVAEELAVAPADVAFIGPTLAADLRRRAGAPAATIPETVAFTGDLGGPSIAVEGGPPDSTAVDAAGAQCALVLLEGAAGPMLATVAVLPVEAEVDLTRTVAPVGGRPIRIDDASPLSADDLARWTALGLTLTCADLVGTMRGAVHLARDYAVERTQYGAAIGSFQAVQHMLADAFVAMEGSRSLTLHAAWAVDALDPAEAVHAAAMAKAYCARAARSVCETVIQVHGGIGNTWECMAHVYLRRALLSTDLFGGTGPNLERVLAHEGIGSDHGLR